MSYVGYAARGYRTRSTDLPIPLTGTPTASPESSRRLSSPSSRGQYVARSAKQTQQLLTRGHEGIVAPTALVSSCLMRHGGIQSPACGTPPTPCLVSRIPGHLLPYVVPLRTSRMASYDGPPLARARGPLSPGCEPREG